MAQVALDDDGVLVDGDGLAGDEGALVGLGIRLLERLHLAVESGADERAGARELPETATRE